MKISYLPEPQLAPALCLHEYEQHKSGGTCRQRFLPVLPFILKRCEQTSPLSLIASQGFHHLH